jgi:predicted phosphoribosyltransferase
MRRERPLLALVLLMTFRNRQDAAERLAWRLRRYAGDRPLVLGIARGAVPMARIIADRLAADLDIVLVGSLRGPVEPEPAIGYVDEFGHVCLADAAREAEGLSREYVHAETHAQLDALRARRQRYTTMDIPADPSGRTVILVDDGFAAASTMTVALRAMRSHNARRVIVATAVASADIIGHLQHEADEVICLSAPAPCSGVPQAFEDFAQVTDDEIKETLGGAAKPPATPR